MTMALGFLLSLSGAGSGAERDFGSGPPQRRSEPERRGTAQNRARVDRKTPISNFPGVLLVRPKC